jgi:hypothetical protein
LRHRNRRSVGQKTHLPSETRENHTESYEKRERTDDCRRRLLLPVTLRLRAGDGEKKEKLELEKKTSQ